MRNLILALMFVHLLLCSLISHNEKEEMEQVFVCSAFDFELEEMFTRTEDLKN